MCGDLVPTAGMVRPHNQLRFARFTQHFVDALDLNESPLSYFMKKYPGMHDEKWASFLGRFGISGSVQLQKMEHLSDGQKSRVVFAEIAYKEPHLLLLDEPTNHLDIETIDSLANAINDYEGGVVLVSHDMRLIDRVAKEIWLCADKKVTLYKGDISTYKTELKKQMKLE